MEDRGKLFYGWWIVLACFFLMFAGIGITLNCTGVFFSAIIEDLQFSREALGLYLTIIALSAMFAFPVLGKLIVKFNSQVVIGICVFVTGIAFAAYSQCTQLWHFYLVSVIVGAFGAGTSTLPASILLTNWFNDKRGLAMGIAFTGSGIGGMLCNPLAQWVIDNYNWQMAYIVLAVLFLAVTMPFVIFIIKLHPTMKGMTALGDTDELEGAMAIHGLTAGQAIKNLSFWIIALCFLILEMITFGVQNNIPIYLKDLGYTATFGATIAAAYMGLLVFGKMLMGSILDKWGARIGIIFGIAMLIGGMFAFANAGYMTLLVVFVIAFALASPMTTVLSSYIVGHVFGNLDYGTIYGLIQIFATVGLAVSMPLSGAIFEKTGSLVPAWFTFIGMAVAVLALFLFLLGRQAKVHDTWHSQDIPA